MTTYAVIVTGATTYPVWAQFLLWAISLACVGLVGSSMSSTARRLFVAALVALVVSGAAVTYAAVVGGEYAYGWCAYAWLINWFC
jgi:hypothetical protein